MPDTIPMLTFDGSPAVIEPPMILSAMENFPRTVVSVFSHTLFAELVKLLDGKQIAETRDVDGVWPVYEVRWRGKRFAFCKARLGAPACVGMFEDILAMGGRRIILLGNCGVLDRNIRDCGIIIPTAALRDEGTSYHYVPPADRIPVNRRGREEFRDLLQKLGYPYVEGITWTTDAFYRETRDKVTARKRSGAICVEMECAAMQAMCDFRGAEFFQFFYAGDNLDHSSWDPRSLAGQARLDEKQKIGLLAFELACAMEDTECL
jgi:uridine phosphorylase